ncbi:MAG TPA: hypothetical protein VI756_04170 [Blastocatellia bacterium]
MRDAITIEHIDEATAAWIAQEARRRGASEESVAVELIRKGIESEKRADAGAVSAGSPPYHDLDSLAGTWSEDEAAEFARVTADFESVDESLWR